MNLIPFPPIHCTCVTCRRVRRGPGLLLAELPDMSTYPLFAANTTPWVVPFVGSSQRPWVLAVSSVWSPRRKAAWSMGIKRSVLCVIAAWLSRTVCSLGLCDYGALGCLSMRLCFLCAVTPRGVRSTVSLSRTYLAPSLHRRGSLTRRWRVCSPRCFITGKSVALKT